MPNAKLCRLLKERGHTMTLAQAEAVTEATKRGEQTGMRVDGWSISSSWKTRQGASRSPTCGPSASVVVGPRTSTSASPILISGTPTIASWSATWRLRNCDSESLYSGFRLILPPFTRVVDGGIVILNTLTFPAQA